MKQKLLERIAKLERSHASSVFSYGKWYSDQLRLADAAAISKLTQADQAALTEFFESGRSPHNLSEQESALWKRWEEAFASIGTEVPIATTFCVYDRWC